MRVGFLGAWAFAGAVVVACGSGGDPTSACMTYCTSLRSGGGCGSDVAACASDCELWIKDSKDANCPGAFSQLLSCANGSGESACAATGGVCSPQWSAWGKCNDACGVPGS